MQFGTEFLTIAERKTKQFHFFNTVNCQCRFCLVKIGLIIVNLQVFHRKLHVVFFSSLVFKRHLKKAFYYEIIVGYSIILLR